MFPSSDCPRSSPRDLIDELVAGLPAQALGLSANKIVSVEDLTF